MIRLCYTIFTILTFLLQNEDDTGILDATDDGILDLLVSKHWAIKLASEAARTVLSVDQIIVARQAGGPKPPQQNPVSEVSPKRPNAVLLTGGKQNWDED